MTPDEPRPAGVASRRRALAAVTAGVVLVGLATLPLAGARVAADVATATRVAAQEATVQRATAADLDPDLVRHLAVAARASGIEWEVLGALVQVVGAPGATTRAATPEERAEATAAVWPVATDPIEQRDPGRRWVTAMLLRDDVTDLPATASLDAVREVGLLLRDRLGRIPEHHADRSFASQPAIYEQAIATLPVRGLDATGAVDTSAAVVGLGAGSPVTASTVAVAGTARTTAARVVAVALGWRAGGACAAGTGLVPYPTNGPIDVGDPLSNGGTMSPVMMANAQVIVEVARRHGLGEQAMVVAISTALQESGLKMLASRAVPASLAFPNDAVVDGDHDSVNTFQQRVSMGWGSLAQLMDPFYAAEAFFGVGRAVGSSGLTRVPGWQHLPVTVAAQAVQRSAFPNAYAKWVPDAAGIVASILGAGAEAAARSPAPSDGSSPAPSSGPSEAPSGPPVRLVSGGTGGAGATGCALLAGAWTGPVRDAPAPGGAMVAVADLPLPGGGTLTVNAAIADRVAALLAAAASDGVVLGGSGWRSTLQQQRLRVQNGCPDVFRAPSSSCRVPTARPGSSQHEVGLAIDFTHAGATLCGTPGCRSYAGFAWLRANAATFGLVNLPSEPWHWSTTGR